MRWRRVVPATGYGAQTPSGAPVACRLIHYAGGIEAESLESGAFLEHLTRAGIGSPKPSPIGQPLPLPSRGAVS